MREGGGGRRALTSRALSQQRQETLLRHWLSENESLANVASHAGQRHRVSRSLDATAHGESAELVCKIDDGFAKRRIDLVAHAVGDEIAADLELHKRKFFQSGKLRAVLSEIVHRKRHLAWGKPVREIDGTREIADNLVLGYVDDQSSKGRVLPLVHPHEIGERQLFRGIDRQIDGDRQIHAHPGEGGSSL